MTDRTAAGSLLINAVFVTIMELFLVTYIPELFRSLVLFIPLIVINCIILGRMSNFSGKIRITSTLINSLGIGMALAAIMLIIALVREIPGAGTITLFSLSGFKGMIKQSGAPFKLSRVMMQAPGALLATGYPIAFISWIILKKKKKSVIRNEKNAEKKSK